MPIPSNAQAALPLSRRGFLASSASAIAVSTLPLASAAKAISPTGGPPSLISPENAEAPPGVARQRIDGLAKVTGEKIYARDFYARDMQGWPAKQWYAMYLRATTTQQRFVGLDLSWLPDAAKPARTIYGDQISGEDPKADGVKNASFNRPKGYQSDLVVQRGKAPDYLGQAVALLLFPSFASYHAARKALQFQDERAQLYSGDHLTGSGTTAVVGPETWFVRMPRPDGSLFSYATDKKTFDAEAPKYAAMVQQYLRNEKGLIVQPFSASMRAMDPMFMEPEAGLVWVDTASESLRLLVGTQSPDGDLAELQGLYAAENAPVKVSEVVITPCYPGGGFGGRDGSPFTNMLAICGAYADGNPVKLAYDRFEQFRVGLKRHATEIGGKIAAAPDMSLQAITMNMEFDSGGRKNLSPYVAQLAAVCAGGSYVIPRADINAQAIHSENISGGSQRGFGGPQAYFAIETGLDDLARRQKWDPIELRRRNLIAREDRTVVGGLVDQSLRLGELLNQAESHPVWQQRALIKEAFAEQGMAYGTGIAMSMQAYGTSGDGVVGAVHLNPDGSFKVRTSAVDMGNGSATTLAVVIGPILGANARVVETSDYHLVPQTQMITGWNQGAQWDNPRWTPKLVESSSACITGLQQVHVVQNAARALLLTSILPAAAAIWGSGQLAEADVKWVDGALTLKAGGTDPLPLAQLAEFIHANKLATGALGQAYFQADWVEATYDTSTISMTLPLAGLALFHGDETKPTPHWRRNTKPTKPEAANYKRTAWAPCVNLIGLSIDRKTWTPRVEKSVSFLNAGKIHVEPLVSGQSQGGIAMALGWTLLEDTPPGMAGPANGTWNLNRYHVPRFEDVPITTGTGLTDRLQELHLLEPVEEDDKVGRGIAEAVMCSVAPAISNALYDALGERFTSLPITADKIRERLAK